MRSLSFETALTAYAVLALLAGLTLDDPIRLATMVLLCGLALKTYIGRLRRKQEEADEAGEPAERGDRED